MQRRTETGFCQNGQKPVALLLAGLLLVLAGCGGRQTRADAPLITPCLEAPTAYVPDEPVPPAEGAPIPDSYVVALKGWANSLLGVVTQDRIAWRGERRCIRRFQEAGQIR